MSNTESLEKEWKFKVNPWITMIPLMLSIFFLDIFKWRSNIN